MIDVILADNGTATVVSSGTDVLSGLEGPQGQRGHDAAAGIVFAWPGLTAAGEPTQYVTCPSSGNFTAANCGGGCDPAHTATADTVYGVMRGAVLIGNVTFHAGVVPPTITIDAAAHVEGDQIGAVPPGTPDTTLQGANFFLAD